jgi:hypothetical protein
MVTELLHFRGKRELSLIDGSSLTSESFMNRADGNSEIEGKAAKGSGERVGKGASFKSAEPVRRRSANVHPQASLFGIWLARKALPDKGRFSENFRQKSKKC